MSVTADCPYKSLLKAIAAVMPSEFNYSLAKCGDNSCELDLNVTASKHYYYDASQLHIFD